MQVHGIWGEGQKDFVLERGWEKSLEVCTGAQLSIHSFTARDRIVKIHQPIPAPGRLTCGGEDRSYIQKQAGCIRLVCSATITKFHTRAGLDNRIFLSRHAGGQKFNIKVLAGWVPAEGCERKSALGLFPSFWSWLACSQQYHPNLCLHPHVVFSL